MTGRFYATGKRKSAVARVWIAPGEGNLLINRQPSGEYFRGEAHRVLLKQAFEVTGTWGAYDAYISVAGGGLTGQAGAIKLGIARALVAADPQLRATLKKAGLLTRDPRVKERKKYGQRGARARFQFSKR
jgi:small subunit ribosomal protein S9